MLTFMRNTFSRIKVSNHRWIVIKTNRYLLLLRFDSKL